MVCVWRCGDRIELVSGRLSVVYLYCGDSGGAAVLQICAAQFLPLWEGCAVWRRSGFISAEYCVAADLGAAGEAELLVVSGLGGLAFLVIGGVMCITVIGIPFGLQHFKLAKLALMPFGAVVY